MAWNLQRNKAGVSPDLEIFKKPPNAQGFDSIVVDASTVVPDSKGDRRLKAGTPMMKNSNGQYQRYTSSASPNNVQTVTVTATSGNVTLTKGGQTTANIAYNANASAVETALEALSNVGDVEVSGSGSVTDPFVITFADPSEAAAITGTGVTVARATASVKGILARSLAFPDGTAKSDLPGELAYHGEVFRADRIVDFGTLATDIRQALPTCLFK